MTSQFPDWDIENQNRIIAVARREQAAALTKYLRRAFAGTVSFVKAAALLVARAAVQARQLAELSRLSDRQLADLGIKRSDIPRYVVGDPLVDTRRLSVPGLKGWTPERASNDWHGTAAA